MTEFQKEYLTNLIINGTDYVQEPVCGVMDNILKQYKGETCLKSFGLFNNKAYAFGSTEGFYNDHTYIINELQEVIGKGQFSVAVTNDCDKFDVNISGCSENAEMLYFGRSIVYGILKECVKVFEIIASKKGLRVTVEVPDMQCRATTLDELKEMLNEAGKLWENSDIAESNKQLKPRDKISSFFSPLFVFQPKSLCKIRR